MLAKLAPLYEKGSVLDPRSCCTLAVSGTLYRLHTTVLREVITGWWQGKIKIIDTQYGFYPG
eukprot:scaffold227512_cov14-Tisochrysis_lutea.AAC.1